MNSKNLIVVASLIVIAVLSRILPHPYNFTPIAGVALFSAAYLGSRWITFLIPMAAMWVSDLFINNVIYGAYTEGFVWFTNGFYWMYGAFALIALLGLVALKSVTFGKVIGSALASSVLFFLITNFGAWIGNPIYPQTFSGLLMSYTAGIPFFQNTVMGDLFYVGALFGAYEYAKMKLPQLAFQR